MDIDEVAGFAGTFYQAGAVVLLHQIHKQSLTLGIERRAVLRAETPFGYDVLHLVIRLARAVFIFRDFPDERKVVFIERLPAQA